jgi:RNA polymerase sigma factor (sigma-70 family)
MRHGSPPRQLAPAPDGSRRHVQASRRSLPSGSDLAALIHAAAHGDQRAWEALVHRFGALVRSVPRRYGLNAADVDDVAQRTWEQLVRHIARLREPGALGAWLAATARNESLRVLRGARREHLTDSDIGAEIAEPLDAHALVEEAERRAALAVALVGIPSRERAILALLLAEQALSYREISAVLRVPIGSIGPTRARGLLRLRQDEQLRRSLGHPAGPAPRSALTDDPHGRT